MTSLSKRRSRSIFGGLALASALFASCTRASLDVGGDGPADAGDERAEGGGGIDQSSPLPDGSLLFTLEQRCALPPGSADRYKSAVELTERLVGRWHLCGTSAVEAPIPDTTVGIELTSQGTFYFLRFTSQKEFLTASTAPEERGTYRYYAYSDPEAGAAIDGGGTNEAGAGDFVSRDDPTVRRGLFIYLRPDNPTSPEDVLVAEFETNPRRLFLARVGASAIDGTFAAIGDIVLK